MLNDLFAPLIKQRIKNGEWWQGDCLDLMQHIPTGSVDMVVTSPPYDDMRSYTNDDTWAFDKFIPIAEELFRVVKKGGVVI